MDLAVNRVFPAEQRFGKLPQAVSEEYYYSQQSSQVHE
jgi:hypothetical protein